MAHASCQRTGTGPNQLAKSVVDDCVASLLGGGSRYADLQDVSIGYRPLNWDLIMSNPEKQNFVGGALAGLAEGP